MSVNFLKHYFILSIFFSEFSSDPLCLIHQLQILYLGIPSLLFSLESMYFTTFWTFSYLVTFVSHMSAQFHF